MTGDVATERVVRVRVLPAWEDVVLRVPPSTRIVDIKVQALSAVQNPADPAEFMVKFRGAALADESRSLDDAKVPSEGALIVMRRHRLPVR